MGLQTQWDQSLILVGLKRYEREIESLQSHLGETEIPIGETKLIRVSGYAMSSELDGAG